MITSKNKSLNVKVILLKEKKDQLEEERTRLLEEKISKIAAIRDKYIKKGGNSNDIPLLLTAGGNRYDIDLLSATGKNKYDKSNPFSFYADGDICIAKSRALGPIDWLYNRKMKKIMMETLKAYEKYKSIHEKNIADLKKATEDELKKFSEGEQEFNEIIKELANAVADLSIEIANIKTELTELDYLTGNFNE